MSNNIMYENIALTSEIPVKIIGKGKIIFSRHDACENFNMESHVQLPPPMERSVLDRLSIYRLTFPRIYSIALF